ncbi:MAG TPA: hypothetical protein VG448_04905 [Solirubrobacterales bacterium]|nr:hypothetical protein [Solirubrobacterales bacterium]
MSKKLITACMALMAFAAFALPAIARAENHPLLVENGAAVPVGAKIWGTNEGITSFTNTSGAAQVECNSVKLTGTVTRNDSGFVEGTITTKDYSGTGAVNADNNLNECTGTSFFSGNSYITVTGNLCIRSTPVMLTDEFQVGTDPAGGNCSETNGKVKFVIGNTSAGACEYETTGLVKGDYTTSETKSLLTVRNTQEGSGAKLIEGGFLCPSSGMLKMTYFMETDAAGNAVLGVIKK